MQPFFQILQGTDDVTARVGKGNISLTITETTDSNADTIAFEIDDQDGIIAPPRTGVDVRVVAGYRDGSVRDWGLFTIDEIVLAGWPQTISVNGQTAGAKSVTKQQRTQSYRGNKYPTYGHLLDEISKRNGLTIAVASDLRSKPLTYEAQQEEDDVAFLTRVGDRVGFDISIKDKRMVAGKRGRGRSVSGERLPLIRVERGFNALDYSVSRQDRNRYGKVKATRFDRDRVEMKEVESTSSSEGPEYRIREKFGTEEEAREAAVTKAEDLRRAAGSASFTINGDPQARAGAFVEASRIRSLVDGLWQSTTVTHEFSAAGPYTTSIECELPGDESDGG